MTPPYSEGAKQPIGETSYQTAGKVAQILLLPDRQKIHHSRDDLSFVSVLAVDSQGVLVPDAVVQLSLSLSSASVGEIAAVGNGDPLDITSTQSQGGGEAARATWRGKALVVLRPTGTTAGKITLTASAWGLPTATVVVVTA
jgi:beta-galactosidase